MVSEDLLIEFGGEKKIFEKDDYLFREGTKAHFYFHIISGEIKMNNFHENGKEFIQSIFSKGRSFGEPPLFIDIVYPANAVAINRAEVILLDKKAFLELLLAHPQVHLEVTKGLAQRLYYKAIMASEISSEEPEHRILTVLDYLKTEVYELSEPFAYKVELTRQQIADLTGLRVETVIRATKSLEKKNELKIKSRKLYR